MKPQQKSSHQATERPSIGEKQIKLLEILSNACGVSGDEGNIRKIILSEIKPIVDDLQIDALGNILAVKRGVGKNLPRVMVSAHMDEVGLIVHHIEGEGFLRFRIIGSLDPRQLPGKQVLVGKEQVLGVIGEKPPHLTSDSEQAAIPVEDELWIDVGPANAAKIRLGDRAAFATKFIRHNGTIIGKALDNRAGVVSLITLLMHAPKNIDLLAAFTTLEEIGQRGAIGAAYTLEPDLAFVVDCTPAKDLPMWDGSENTRYTSKINEGPAVYTENRDMLSDPRLIKFLRNTAKTYQIPYQLRQPGGGRTDASKIHQQRGGIPSITISTPVRYIHSAASKIMVEDWQNCLSLVHAALSETTRGILEQTR